MLLLSAFFAIFGSFAVALKWLTERSGRQWSWPGVCGGPAQTLGSSQLAGTCGIVHSGVAVIRAVVLYERKMERKRKIPSSVRPKLILVC